MKHGVRCQDSGRRRHSRSENCVWNEKGRVLVEKDRRTFPTDQSLWGDLHSSWSSHILGTSDVRRGNGTPSTLAQRPVSPVANVPRRDRRTTGPPTEARPPWGKKRRPTREAGTALRGRIWGMDGSRARRERGEARQPDRRDVLVARARREKKKSKRSNNT